MKRIDWKNYQNKKWSDPRQLFQQTGKELEQISSDLEVDCLEIWKQKVKEANFANVEEIRNYKCSLFRGALKAKLNSLSQKKEKDEIYRKIYYHFEKGWDGKDHERTHGEKEVRNELEIPLFNYQLFLKASQIENNDLAHIMASFYQEHQEIINQIIRELKKRIELEQLRMKHESDHKGNKDMVIYLLKERIIVDELEIEGLRIFLAGKSNEHERLKSQIVNSLASIDTASPEKHISPSSSSSELATPLTPASSKTLVNSEIEAPQVEKLLSEVGERLANYQKIVAEREELAKENQQNKKIIVKAQKYLGCKENPVNLNELPEMDEDMNLVGLINWWRESDKVISGETGLDIFDTDEEGDLAINQDKINFYRDAENLLADAALLSKKIGVDLKTLAADLKTGRRVIVASGQEAGPGLKTGLVFSAVVIVALLFCNCWQIRTKNKNRKQK